MSAFTARLDRTAERRMLARFKPHEVDHVLLEAAKVGGQAGAKVLRSNAPVGTAARLSQYYRAHGLSHGTLRKSVRAAQIRGRHTAIVGLQGRTVGYVIGPIGRQAFTRAWVEARTHWTEHTAPAALAVAHDASDAVLVLYGASR